MSHFIGWLLNAAYLGTLVVFSPAIAWASWRTGKYREGWREKLWGIVPQRAGTRPCAWLHAVSVGEVNLLATTIRELVAREPALELVITTTTKTGYELARRKYGSQHLVCYCPLDFTWAVTRALARLRPDRLVLAELELWPNLIAAAKRRGIPVAIINGRLSENSFRGYSRVRWLARRVLSQIDLIAAQDEATATRFLDLGAAADRVVITGSLKYDGAETNRDNPRTTALRELAGFGPNKKVWLVGSTQAPEEKFAIDIFKRAHRDHPELRLVLVPRHAERFDEVASLLNSSGLAWTRRSQLPASCPPPTAHRPHPTVILVDTIGELGAWWGTAHIGFVGGSFGNRGGQNMIEPAAYGVATCFGPNTRNFRDIVAALINVDGARVVADAVELEAFVRKCLMDEDFGKSLGKRASRFVATQLGATKRTVDLLQQLTPNATRQATRAA